MKKNPVMHTVMLFGAEYTVSNTPANSDFVHICVDGHRCTITFTSVNHLGKSQHAR
jgi:hypothetical protein